MIVMCNGLSVFATVNGDRAPLKNYMFERGLTPANEAKFEEGVTYPAFTETDRHSDRVVVAVFYLGPRSSPETHH
jgi:hypothetical protein